MDSSQTPILKRTISELLESDQDLLLAQSLEPIHADEGDAADPGPAGASEACESPTPKRYLKHSDDTVPEVVDPGIFSTDVSIPRDIAAELPSVDALPPQGFLLGFLSTL
mgnify:CR=1 FL=1